MKLNKCNVYKCFMSGIVSIGVIAVRTLVNFIDFEGMSDKVVI